MPSRNKRTYSVRLEVENGNVVKADLADVGRSGSASIRKIGEAGIQASRGLGALRIAAGALNFARRSLLNLRTAAVGLLGAAGFGALTFQALDYASSIDDLSQTANVGAEALQELKFAGAQLGIELEAITDGLKEVTLRADEFATTGGGPAAEAFERLNLSQAEVQELLKDTDKLFTVLINRLRETGDAAATVRISDELFGGSAGEQFVRFVNQSSSAIADLRNEARELGIVLSEDAVRGADEARDRLRVLGDVLRLNVSRAIVENSERITEFADRVIRNLPQVIDQFERLAEVLGIISRAPTVENLNAINAEISELRRQLEDGPTLGDTLLTMVATPGRDTLVPQDTIGQQRARDRIAELEEERVQIEAVLQEQEELNRRREEGAEVVRQGAEAQAGETEAVDRASVSLLRLNDSRRQTTEGARSSVETNMRLINGLEFEIDLMGLSAREQAILRAERRLSAEATEEQVRQVRELAGALYDEREAQREVEKQTRETEREYEELGRTIERGVDDVLRGNLNTWEDWGNFAVDVIRDVIRNLDDLNDASVNLPTSGGSGGGFGSVFSGIGNFVGGLFGGGSSLPSIPGRATGGPVVAGRAYRFREIQDEVLVPNVNGVAVPTSQLGGGGDISIMIENNTNTQASAQARNGANGERQLLVTLDEVVAGNIGRPGSSTRRALRSFQSEGVNR